MRRRCADIGAGTLCEGVPDPTRVDPSYSLVPKSPHPPKGFHRAGEIVKSTTDTSIVTTNNFNRPAEQFNPTRPPDA